MAFTLLSPHFEPMGEIPTKYTCDGQNVSPALQWRNPPEGTKSFALIVDDPDIPFGIKDSHGKILSIWDHWVLFNIPSSVSELPEAIQSLPAGTQNGQGRLLWSLSTRQTSSLFFQTLCIGHVSFSCRRGNKAGS